MVINATWEEKIMEQVAVQLVDVTIKAPKELNDVRIAAVKFVEDIKAKKPIGDIASGSLGNFIAAVEGADKIDDEFKEEARKSAALAGLMGGEIIGAVMGESAPANGGEPVVEGAPV
jgi:hypothetical protein